MMGAFEDASAKAPADRNIAAKAAESVRVFKVFVILLSRCWDNALNLRATYVAGLEPTLNVMFILGLTGGLQWQRKTPARRTPGFKVGSLGDHFAGDRACPAEVEDFGD
jgi:hypothetical protein